MTVTEYHKYIYSPINTESETRAAEMKKVYEQLGYECTTITNPETFELIAKKKVQTKEE